MKCVLSVKESNSNAIMGLNFHISLQSLPRGLNHAPTPFPFKVSLTVTKLLFMLKTSLYWKLLRCSLSFAVILGQ